MPHTFTCTTLGATTISVIPDFKSPYYHTTSSLERLQTLPARTQWTPLQYLAMTKPVRNQTWRRSPKSCSLKSRQFKGIRMRKWGKWVSEVRIPNSSARIWLGSYDTPEKAARAYDFATYCLRGSKANLNFPHSPPKISFPAFLSPQQIQTAAAKFAADEFRLLPENGGASSSYSLEEECDINSEQIFWEQAATFGDSVAVESMENGGGFNVRDIPPLDVLMKDFGIPFELPEDWELGIF